MHILQAEQLRNTPILYSFRRCPYAIRARLALAYAGIRVVLREVRLHQQPDEMIAASPKGSVPVLVLADGQVLEESLDIMFWALSVKDAEHWKTADPTDLIKENDLVFKPLLDRYKYADRSAPLSQAERRAAALPFIMHLDTRLQRQTYLTSSTMPTVVDAAIVPFIRQFAGVEPKWFDACAPDALRQWLQKMLTTTLFQRVMRKYDYWKPTDEPVYFEY